MSKRSSTFRILFSCFLLSFLVLNFTTASLHFSSLAEQSLGTDNGRATAIGLRNDLQPPSAQQYGLAISSLRRPNPISGILKVLTVFVKFSDFSNTTNIDTINTSKITPMMSYYDEVSYGTLSLELENSQSWFTLPSSRAHYGADSGVQIDVNILDFIHDSLNVADLSFNYHDYGYVILVHAGRDQASSGDANDIWSRATAGKEFYMNDGGVWLGVVIVAETDPYGVFAHEFGHNIELPDLYDYDDKEEFVGKWSLMDYGSWLTPPTSLMAPEKMWLGWVQPSNVTVVDTGQILNITLAELETPGQVLAVKIPASPAYYVVEYRRRVLTDSRLPTEGVIVSRVDEAAQGGHGIVVVADAKPYTETLDDAAFTSGTEFVDQIDEVAVKVLLLDSENASIVAQKGFADLVADSVQFIGQILEGQSIYFDVNVNNIGVAPSDSVFVSLSVNGTELQTTGLAPVNPGSSSLLEFGPWQAETGVHQIEVSVDVNNDVLEKNKTNNVLTAILNVPPHHVSIDQSEVSRQRTDVSSSEQVRFHAQWSDNGSDIADGILYVNGSACTTNATGWATITVTSSVVANISWLITGVNVNGFLSYHQNTPSPWIVWDMLEAYDSAVSRERCDLNSTQSIWVRVRYAYDGKAFDNSTGLLWMGGRAAEWSAQGGYWAIDDSMQDVGQRNYSVPSGFDDMLFGLRLIGGSTQVSIVWDRVDVDVSAEDQRTSIGSPAKVWVNGTYEFDSAVWNGTVLFNDTLTKNEVGAFPLGVASISDPLYGLTAFKSNTISIVFDRLLLNVSVLDARINVGENARVIVKGVYEYDSSSWHGNFVLNDTVTKTETGNKGFRVVSVTDPEYNLTAFRSNYVSVIWDRVNLTLSSPQQRVATGSRAPISWKGNYEWDGTSFEGNVTLNEDLVKNSVGSVSYTVGNISDSLYGLTAFTSNTVSVVFDDIAYSIKTETSVPGRVKLEVDLTYQSDGKPVTDANITVQARGADNVGNGRYVVALSEWKPYTTYRLTIEKETFGKDFSATFVAFGNLGIIVVVVILVVVIAVLLGVRRKRSRQDIKSHI